MSRCSALTSSKLEVTEISPRECTKREGIQSVLDALDPNHGTVYGIGDASNDISLMNAVDVGIAMGNAPDYLKKRADYITDSVDKDGVVKRSSTLDWSNYETRPTCAVALNPQTCHAGSTMWQYVACTLHRCNLRKNARTRVQSVYLLFSPAL